MWLNFRSQTKYKLNILCILDEFSAQMFAREPNVQLDHAQPGKFPKPSQKYDFLLIESAWLGHQQRWKYKIAEYPEYPERNLNDITALVNWAKSQNIPTIFWNKEDPFHFSQFIKTAQLFDYILTTDISITPKYESLCLTAKVSALSFPFQPKIHYPQALTQIKIKSSVFIGSYVRHMHNQRQYWQDMCFNAAAPYGLSVYDRHAKLAKKTINYQFPEIHNIDYHNTIPYHKTARYYHHYQQAINVNTITDSPTMYSRRLIEIMACNRLVISNPSAAIDHLFPGLCECIESPEQAQALFEQLQYGYTAKQIEKVQAAGELVFKKYTVNMWLRKLLNLCKIDHAFLDKTPQIEIPRFG